MSTVNTNPGFAKPIKLRIIFILNALKIFLTFGFLWRSSMEALCCRAWRETLPRR
jgi:hypothetical protein